jgi:hypothetical protein
MSHVRAGCRLVLKTTLLFGLACQPVFSFSNQVEHDRWAAQVSSDGRSYFTDEPDCHPREYFSDGIRQLFLKQFKNPKDPNFFEDTVSAWRIGEISGRKIEQHEHRINQSSQNPMTVKMLLLERKPEELCEIYHQEWLTREVDVMPAHLVTVGEDVILATKDRFRKGGRPLESYWTFDAQGPINLEVGDKIDGVQTRLLPKNALVRKGGEFDVSTLTYSTNVWKEKDPTCCPTGGHIEIKFALKQHQLVVLSEHFSTK